MNITKFFDRLNSASDYINKKMMPVYLISGLLTLPMIFLAWIFKNNQIIGWIGTIDVLTFITTMPICGEKVSNHDKDNS